MLEMKSDQEKWTVEALALLGKLPDSAVAIRMGTTSMQVRRKRIELGVAAWQATVTDKLVKEPRCSMSRKPRDPWISSPSRSRVPQKPKPMMTKTEKRPLSPESAFGLSAKHWWTDSDINLLGTMPDEAVATVMGIAVKEVRFMRIKLFIKIYRPETKG